MFDMAFVWTTYTCTGSTRTWKRRCEQKQSKSLFPLSRNLLESTTLRWEKEGNMERTDKPRHTQPTTHVCNTHTHTRTHTGTFFLPRSFSDFHMQTHTRTLIDWCCFYYFVKNSLVALLKALCTRKQYYHTRTHTQIHTRTYTHTHTNTRIHTQTHTHTHTHTHRERETHKNTQIRTPRHARIHACTCKLAGFHQLSPNIQSKLFSPQIVCARVRVCVQAKTVKETMDKKFAPNWHCFIGQVCVIGI